MELKVRNVNSAVQEGFWKMKILGVRESSRNGEVIRIPEPVMTTYENPAERVLFWPERDANPIFHLMESLWMLAGRNDLAFVQYFNSRMGQFSDDGVVLNGAYGHRWRNRFGADQLVELVEHLQKNPDSRRAVLTMWGVDADLAQIEESKDVCCVSGGTRFSSPEESYTIKVLARKFRDGSLTRYPIYGVDTVTGEVKLTWMTSAWKVGTKKTICLRGDAGEVLRCTEDHRVWVRRKVFQGKRCTAVELLEVEAGTVKAGDVLLSVRFGIQGNGARTYKANTFGNTSFGNMRTEHRAYAELLFGRLTPDFDVHHLDGDKANNKDSNICLMTSGGHAGHHRLTDNPMRKMPKELRRIKGAEHSKVLLSKGRYSPRSVKQPQREYGLQEPLPKQIRIATVTPGDACEVFDFSVPETHNAATSDGFVIHNCNTQCFFEIQNGKLNMTVLNRSNDMIWGAYGANAVHFSVLQEFIAAAIDVPLGVYRQFSHNLHMYTGLYDYGKYVELPPDTQQHDAYAANMVRPYALCSSSWRQWLRDCELFCEDPFADPVMRYYDPFFSRVAYPMAMVVRERKSGSSNGYYWAEMCEAEDWKLATKQWIDRREAAKNAK